MIDRIATIEKESAITHSSPIALDFSKIRVGIKTLDDAVVNLGDYKRVNPKYGDKDYINNAINRGDAAALREISNFFYKASGIYGRVCRYFAYLYRYDWMITPYMGGGTYFIKENEIKKTEKERLLRDFFSALSLLDNFEVKRFFGEVALKVIRFGCYYGYIIRQEEGTISIQELPQQYCRSRYSVNKRPAVEFNMKFFDETYSSTEQRTKILKLFPAEFRKGYKAYKDGKLVPDFAGDSTGWYLLNIDNTIKFNLNGDDFPIFISAIPAIIELNEAQDLNNKRMLQKLLKILIQKMPIDKNGDLIFDVDEAQALHNNAVKMLSRAIGIDVLTTFADVEVADMSDRSNTSATDDLQRVERSVYNEFGTAQSIFNSSSSVALNNSIINDESSIMNLIQQFESFLNVLLSQYNKNPKKNYLKAQILSTTVYNYKEVAKMYKEQTQMGYSKILPQIALGQSQSSVLANAYFENDILNLLNVLVPPLTSNTMNADALAAINGEEKEVGRPEKEDSEKSDKTIANRESM